MAATIETVCVKLDGIATTLEGIEKRNEEDHKAMQSEQATITKRLSAIDVQEAEAGKDIETNAKDIRHHAKRCEKRHTGLNKKLWAFVAAALVAAGGIMLQSILGGAS